MIEVFTFEDHEAKVQFWRTVIAVIATGLLTFFGATYYDIAAHGQEARIAAINSDETLEQFADLQERNECVATYAIADVTAQANLLIVLGRVMVFNNIGEPLPGALLDDINEATADRSFYLSLRSQTNERCDPTRSTGLEPLPENQQPDINGE